MRQCADAAVCAPAATAPPPACVAPTGYASAEARSASWTCRRRCRVDECADGGQASRALRRRRTRRAFSGSMQRQRSQRTAVTNVKRRDSRLFATFRACRR